MSCVKCNEIFELKGEVSEIYWMSNSEELTQKIKLFLRVQDVDISHKNDFTTVNVQNTKDFFVQRKNNILEYFNYLELEDIKIFVAYTNTEFGFSSILNAKSLQSYINFIEDEDFFYIVNNASLEFHFQPIVDVQNGTIYGYEALVRGVRADGSLMYPYQLFRKSERNNFNFRLDKLCREMALKAAAKNNIKKKLFVNFIPTSIYDPRFCLSSTMQWAKKLNFDFKNIIFEVVRSESVKDKAHLKNILNYYREQGFEVALDNLGEENSELNMMIGLKPNIIKVDRNILQNIHNDKLKQSTYKALYNLAKENNIKVIAAKVESQPEYEALVKIGVDYVQGHYISMPTKEAETYIYGLENLLRVSKPVF